ncbi:MAG: Ferredoxin, partial [uncultured Rubrobacteraceae bacterium]
DLCDHGAVHRHEGPVLRRGVPGRLHLRRGRPFHDQPRGVHRLRRLRARVPGRGDIPRGRGPGRPGELHRQGRQLLRV